MGIARNGQLTQFAAWQITLKIIGKSTNKVAVFHDYFGLREGEQNISPNSKWEFTYWSVGSYDASCHFYFHVNLSNTFAVLSCQTIFQSHLWVYPLHGAHG